MSVRWFIVVDGVVWHESRNLSDAVRDFKEDRAAYMNADLSVKVYRVSFKSGAMTEHFKTFAGTSATQEMI